jgi:hypothetical protein
MEHPASPNKKKLKKDSDKLKIDTALKESRLLVVLPASSFIAFQMAGDVNDTSEVPTLFRNWCNEYNNNCDALINNDTSNPNQLFHFVENGNNFTTTMNGPDAVWAFMLRTLFGNVSVNGSLRFTVSNTLIDIAKGQDRDKWGMFIAKNFNYVILTDNSGEMETLLDFCSLQMVKRQVCVFPPISLLHALANKHEIRDPPLTKVKLPHVLVVAGNSFADTANTAKAALHELAPTANLSRLVAKLNKSSCGLGVFFLTENQNEGWTVQNNYIVGLVHDEMQRENNKIKPGTILDFEPFCDSLKKEELRLFGFLRANSMILGVSALFAVKTTNKSNGTIKVERTPYTMTNTENAGITKLCSTAIGLLMATNQSCWRSIRYLIFRFDIAREGDTIYINEIDLFPMAASFIDDFVTGEKYMKDMAECTFNYFYDHNSSNTPWPM